MDQLIRTAPAKTNNGKSFDLFVQEELRKRVESLKQRMNT